VTTIGEWLDTRTPAPPAALLARLRSALGDALALDAGAAADSCLSAGEAVLATVLQAQDSKRTCALDLLTADALVTYSFEAASERPADLAARAANAMSHIAALGLVTSDGVSA
jgi:hypothetical protein